MPPLFHLTYYIPTKCNLHFANFTDTVPKDPGLHRLVTFQVPNLMSTFCSFSHSKESIQVHDTAFIKLYYALIVNFLKLVTII